MKTATSIPPTKEHRLWFGVITIDAAQIALRRNSPSESEVRNGRDARVTGNPRAYIMRVDDEYNNIYTAAISFPSRAEFRLTCWK